MVHYWLCKNHKCCINTWTLHFRQNFFILVQLIIFAMPIHNGYFYCSKSRGAVYTLATYLKLIAKMISMYSQRLVTMVYVMLHAISLEDHTFWFQVHDLTLPQLQVAWITLRACVKKGNQLRSSSTAKIKCIKLSTPC